MALTLVYTGEHYVVDVVAGWVAAVIAVVAGSGLHRRRAGGYADDPPRSSRSYAA